MMAWSSDPSTRRRLREGLVVAICYALIATFYIVLSDRLLVLLVSDPDALSELQTYKGLAFVALTAIGLMATWVLLAQHEQHERQARQAALRRLGSLGEGMPSPFIVLDPDGRFQEWNVAFQRAAGYSPGDLGRLGVRDLTHPDDLAHTQEAISRILNTGLPDNADVRMMTAGGDVLFHRWYGAALRDADGRIDGIAAVGVEMTDLIAVQDRLRETLSRSEKMLRQTVDALMRAVETRDPWAAGHERQVASLSLAIAEEMGLPREDREGLEYAALLLDIGKLAVPADILVKAGSLTASERAMVETHAEHGYEILHEVDFPWPVAEAIRQHHERYDGSGYPAGLAGNAILIEARIAGLADVVSAMCSHRPYRPALGAPAALDEVQAGRGTRYDPQVADACLKVFERVFEFGDKTA